MLALFAYVRVVPIGFSVLLSLYKWKLISPLKPFIGFDNYIQLMSDDNFILALKNTTLYSLSTVLISIVLALPLALFLAGGRRLSAFYQTVYFLPVITPMVPMAIAWKWIYDYNYGIFNYGLSLVGIALVFINGYWVGVVLAFLCARFRDLEQIIRNLLQLGFFVTQVFWKSELVVSSKRAIVDYNVLFYFIEIIRAPLLGQVPPMKYYAVTVGCTIIGYLLAVLVYQRMRRRLAFFVA